MIESNKLKKLNLEFYPAVCYFKDSKSVDILNGASGKINNVPNIRNKKGEIEFKSQKYYIPILDVINIEDDEVIFYNSLNSTSTVKAAKNNIYSLRAGVSNFMDNNYNLYFNFTDRPVTVVDTDGMVSVKRPIAVNDTNSDRVKDLYNRYKGKVLVINVKIITYPFTYMLDNNVSLFVYLKNMFSNINNRKAAFNLKVLDFIEEARNYIDIENDDVISTAKVVSFLEIHEDKLYNSENQFEDKYIEEIDVIISYRRPDKVNKHPNLLVCPLDDMQTIRDLTGSIRIFIVDNHSKLKSIKYIPIGEKVFKVPVQRDSNRDDGLYVIVNNEVMNYYTLEDVYKGVVPFIFNSEEEANEGMKHEIKVLKDLEKEAEVKKREIELTKIEQMSQSAKISEYKEMFDLMKGYMKETNEMIKKMQEENINSIKTISETMKNQLNELTNVVLNHKKNESEMNYKQYRYELENDYYYRKNYYDIVKMARANELDEAKFNRDYTMEVLKFGAGILAGVGLYKVFKN